MDNRFSGFVSVFHARSLPEPQASLAGYAALIETYKLQVPLPEQCAAISLHHKRYATTEWTIYTPRHKPKDSLAGHLTFALKYEGIDLAVLKSLFNAIDSQEIADWVRSEPTSRYSRRVWFLYEWLMQKKLPVADAINGNFFDVLDETLQYPGASELSQRHRIRNNLPGTPDFCPLIRRTATLEKYINLHLDVVAHKKIKAMRPDLLNRASAFLLLQDSQASFTIEHETPPSARIERWGTALGQAGKQPLTLEELLRLQAIVLEGSRFIELGFRREGGFIGTHNRVTGSPQPDHISARWDNLDQLLDGFFATYNRLKASPLNPVLQASLLAFGFVFIHPFIDGNGRIHRYLIQQILAECEFIPFSIVLPISAVILENIDAYRQVLEQYSHPRLAFIQWKEDAHKNIVVLNETIDLYRYFDATKQAEFLFKCVDYAIRQSLPQEIIYLQQHDLMKEALKKDFGMTDNQSSLMIHFLSQNNGLLSKRVKNKEFSALSTDECLRIEKLYVAIFVIETAEQE